MAKPAQHHIIPDSGRICASLNKADLKEVRKLSIDLEIPESEVNQLAIAVLIERYKSIPSDEVSERGYAALFQTPEAAERYHTGAIERARTRNRRAKDE